MLKLSEGHISASWKQGARWDLKAYATGKSTNILQMKLAGLSIMLNEGLFHLMLNSILI